MAAGSWAGESAGGAAPTDSWQHPHRRPLMRALHALARALVQVRTCFAAVSPLSRRIAEGMTRCVVCIECISLRCECLLYVVVLGWQAGRYKDGILHSMRVLEMDASDPLHQVRVCYVCAGCVGLCAPCSLASGLISVCVFFQTNLDLTP